MIGTNLLIIDYQNPLGCKISVMYFTVQLQQKVFQRLPDSDTAFRNVIPQRQLVRQGTHTTQSALETSQIHPSASKANLKATFSYHLQVAPVRMKFDAMISHPELHIPC